MGTGQNMKSFVTFIVWKGDGIQSKVPTQLRGSLFLSLQVRVTMQNKSIKIIISLWHLSASFSQINGPTVAKSNWQLINIQVAEKKWVPCRV